MYILGGGTVEKPLSSTLAGTLLKLSFRSWKRNPVSLLLSALVLASLLFLSVSLSTIHVMLKHAANDLSQKQELVLFVDPRMTQESLAKFEAKFKDTIQTQIGSGPKWRWIEKEEILNSLKSDAPGLAEQVYSLGEEMNQTLPQMVSIKGEVSEAQKRALSSLEGVLRIEEAATQWRPVERSLRVIEKTSLAFGVFLAGLSFYFLFLLVGVNESTRGSLLSLGGSRLDPSDLSTARFLELMGAKSWQRAAPSLLNGLWLGLVAGIFAACSWFFLTRALGNFQAVFNDKIAVISPKNFSLSWAAGLILLSASAGVFAGFTQLTLANIHQRLSARASRLGARAN